MKNVVYIHGMNSTSRSFSYVRKQLAIPTDSAVNYESYQALDASIEQVRKQLPKGELILIGHSLGGVIATLLASEEERVKKLVTIASPLGGSKAAAAMRWFFGSLPVMGDITPTSRHMTLCKNLALEIPTLSIITTGGNMPTMTEPNDGVVTCDSQSALKFGKKVEIKSNHFEVLLHDKAIKVVGDFVFKGEELEEPPA